MQLNFFKGFGLAVLVNLLVLLAIYLFFERTGSFLFFLDSSWKLKTLVAYLSIGSIPNVLLANFAPRSKSNTDFIRGILAEIIVVFVLIAILKFLL